MAETTTPERTAPTHFMGTEIRDGKIRSSNSDRNVEDRYPVAYNLGSGRALWAGWINIDADGYGDLQADLRRLPVDSDSADAVAAIHVLEHFYEWEAADLLTEWKRILKPGGKMILELPCMDKVFGYAVQCVREKEGMVEFMTLHALYGDPKHHNPMMCHKWGWFTVPLKAVLEQIGMREIQIMQPRYHFPMRDMRLEAIK